jgi:hypothetical protein
MSIMTCLIFNTDKKDIKLMPFLIGINFDKRAH